VVILLRLAGLVSVISGLIGGYVWLTDLEDRSDGDSLRLGFWHNPFMQFPPFNEAFLDVSMWLLLACSAAVGVGGLMLLVPRKWGVPLVTWQARVSVAINSAIAFCIVVTMFVFAKDQHGEWHLGGTSIALTLRLGSIAVDLMLWVFLSSKVVSDYFDWQAHPADRAFDVIMKQAKGTLACPIERTPSSGADVPTAIIPHRAPH
jgi:hypothetical protein